jgi:hypothetical protein
MNSRLWRLAASSTAICGALIATNAWAALSVDVASSRADLVSNASALVVIRGANGTPSVRWDNRDISRLFSPDPNNPGQFIGLVVGFIDGKNVPIEVRAGGEVKTLQIVNHAVNKQLFSGPLQVPFVCELDALGLKPSNTSHLDPKNADCTAPSVIQYVYKTTDGDWKPFDPNKRPTNIMSAKIDGNDVPLIVRQEKGVINRSGFVIDILHDPQAGPAPSFLGKGGSAWNGKLVYSFGPGAKAGYHQGRNFGGLAAGLGNIEETGIGAEDAWITRGYAIAAGSLNSFGTSTDDVVSAETAYKVKEQFIKEFGLPIYTLGAGSSGGSMGQQLVANAYPGILDGIIPERQFADAITFEQPEFDCELLVNVFKQGTWTRAQMDAVSGMFWGWCVSNGPRYPAQRADNCHAVVVDAVNKDPILKAAGVRCTYQDNMVHTFGYDPKTGFARSPWDNAGVQYGLVALNSGVISWDQFLDINARIGGHDVATGKIVAQRQIGDPESLKIVYQTGRMNEETGGLASIPQIAIRDWRDGDPFGRGDANVDVHARVHSSIVRARLQKYLGTTGTSVEMTAAYDLTNYNFTVHGSPMNTAYVEALDAMDKWIIAIKSDKSNKSPTDKVVANKPATLVDACYPVQSGGLLSTVVRVTDVAKCNQIFPQSTTPRIAAGGPPTEDVMKCQLKPVNAADYKTAPTADQLAKLKTVFPDGVCDYTKPGVGQDQKIVTWAIFKDAGELVGL